MRGTSQTPKSAKILGTNPKPLTCTGAFTTGQYLYDYEATEGDPDFNQPRKFPCTRFTVRRHRDEGYVADILCEGEVLEPEILAPAFTLVDYERGEVPEDGQVLNVAYDRLKEGASRPAQR
jgi:hypothetical protein